MDLDWSFIQTQGRKRRMRNTTNLISDQTLPNGRRRCAMKHVARVRHGQMLVAAGVRQHPGHHVNDLAAVQVDDAEGGALFDFEGVAMAAGDDVRLTFMGGFGNRVWV